MLKQTFKYKKCFPKIKSAEGSDYPKTFQETMHIISIYLRTLLHYDYDKYFLLVRTGCLKYNTFFFTFCHELFTSH